MAATDDKVIFLRSFGEIIDDWALQAAEQLRDTFTQQKIYVRGGSYASYEVWRHNKRRTVYTYDRPYQPGQKRRRRSRKTFSSWGWYDENRLRMLKKQQNPNVDYWYSTGESYKAINVTTHDISEDPNRFWVSGEVRFATTSHLAFAEAGVGKTGRNRVRAAKGRDIDIYRASSFRHDQRYAPRWKPMEGETHRPSTRQQVWYMSRRMRWLGNKYFGYKVNTWLMATLQEFLDTGSQPISIGGIGVTISNENK